MTFSISLPSMFNSIIEQKDLVKSYNDLFGFRIIIDIDILKCDGQCPRFMYVIVREYGQTSD